jgi:chromosome segregation ATPase
MDPIEAIEELASRVETLLTNVREADSRIAAAQADATQWRQKAEVLEAQLEAQKAEGKAREERMEKAAARVKALLDQLPTEA